MDSAELVEPLLVFAGDDDVFIGPALQVRAFFIAEGTHDLCGASENERTPGDFCAFGDERPGAYYGLCTDHCAIKDGRLHADEAFVPDFACVNYRSMPNRDVFAYLNAVVVGQVDNRPVLHIGTFSDLDRVDVTAEDCVVPYARVFAERDSSDYDCSACDIGASVDGGPSVEVFFDAFNEIHFKRP